MLYNIKSNSLQRIENFIFDESKTYFRRLDINNGSSLLTFVTSRFIKRNQSITNRFLQYITSTPLIFFSLQLVLTCLIELDNFNFFISLSLSKRIVG